MRAFYCETKDYILLKFLGFTHIFTRKCWPQPSERRPALTLIWKSTLTTVSAVNSDYLFHHDWALTASWLRGLLFGLFIRAQVPLTTTSTLYSPPREVSLWAYFLGIPFFRKILSMLSLSHSHQHLFFNFPDINHNLFNFLLNIPFWGCSSGSLLYQESLL